MKPILLFLLVASIGFTSCKKGENCVPINPVCSEAAPTNEACLAVFLRWFYNADSKTCSQQSYSGCSQKGFATLEECEDCECK